MIKKPSDFGGLCFCRVVVVGANGAGKTWLATRLAAAMQVRVIHKDALALTQNWVQRPPDVVQAAIVDAISAEAWALEGGPSILTLDVLDRADLVVWLDVPAWRRFWRIIRRSLRYAGRVRPEHPPGNRDWPGLRQARFAWRAFTRGDQFEVAIAQALQGTSVQVVHLSSRADVAKLLVQVHNSRMNT